jgi:hypothetical protein
VLYVSARAPIQVPAGVPVTINGNQRLYVDLRDGLSHGLLAGSP